MARLYERRQRLEDDTAAAMQSVIAQAGLPDPGMSAHLHVLFRPLLSDRGLRERAVPASDIERGLRGLVMTTTNRLRFAEPWSPELSQVVSGSLSRTVDGYALLAGTDTKARHIELHVSDSGEVRVTTTGAAEPRDSAMTGGVAVFTLRDGSIAHFVTQAANVAGDLYASGGYLGIVDGACAVLGAGDAVSALAHDARLGDHLGRPRAPLPHEYRRVGRWPASLLQQDPVAVARELVSPLLEAARQGAVEQLFAVR